VEGSYSRLVPLNDTLQNRTIIVRATASVDGREVSGRWVLGPGADNPIGRVPSWLTTYASIALIWMSAGLFSQRNAGVGAVIVSLEGGLLWFLGFLSTAVTGGAVAAALAIAVVAKSGRDRL
jgi:hypothetical protein